MRVKIKQSTFILFLGMLFFLFIKCDNPFKDTDEAYFIVRNSSTSYNITAVYYGKISLGSNRISSDITPGKSKKFILDAEDDHYYDIQVNSDNSGLSNYSMEDVSFYDKRTITIELTDDSWVEYYPW